MLGAQKSANSDLEQSPRKLLEARDVTSTPCGAVMAEIRAASCTVRQSLGLVGGGGGGIFTNKAQFEGITARTCSKALAIAAPRNVRPECSYVLQSSPSAWTKKLKTKRQSGPFLTPKCRRIKNPTPSRRNPYF